MAIMPTGSVPPNMPSATDLTRLACGAGNALTPACEGSPMLQGEEQQDVHHRRRDGHGHHDADAEHYLLAPGRGADQLAGLEILQTVAGNRCEVLCRPRPWDKHHRDGADRRF